MLRRYTTYGSITCRREAGWLWRGWDYECEGRKGPDCEVFDVEVSASDVITQDGPGNCGAETSRELSAGSRRLAISRLLPRQATLDHVWYSSGRSGTGEIVIAWHHSHGHRISGWNDPRRYVLAVWHRTGAGDGPSAPLLQTLIHASPFPLSDRSVRFADVTGDGRDDLLVTVVCSDCNHGAAVASVYARFGRKMRRIYGHGSLGVAKGPGANALVRGRNLTETWWGARNGMIWFDEPRGGTAVCCPAYRLQTFLRWTPHGWHTVSRRRVSPQFDRLIRRPFP